MLLAKWKELPDLVVCESALVKSNLLGLWDEALDNVHWTASMKSFHLAIAEMFNVFPNHRSITTFYCNLPPLL